MKIGPAPLPLPQRVQQEARAAGFDERGMFGLNRGQAAPRFAPAHPQKAQVPDRQPGPLEQTPEPERQATPALHRETASPARSALPAVTENPAPQPSRLAGQACSLPEAVPGKAVEIESCAGPSRRAPRPARPDPRAGPQVSLVLREAEGAAEIVAGAPPLDAGTRAELRRLIEALLARHGLRLAKFQLNGAAAGPDFLGRRGGSHGTRTD